MFLSINYNLVYYSKRLHGLLFNVSIMSYFLRLKSKEQKSCNGYREQTNFYSAKLKPTMTRFLTTIVRFSVQSAKLVKMST